MSKTITSGLITFLDTTDDRKLDVYISSNHPTVQLHNSNTKVYTPDWSTTNLQLSAEIYLDSKDVTTDYQTDIGWYAKIGTTETLIGTGTEITMSTNALAVNPIIAYVCKAQYQNIKAESQLTFTRVDTGLNGADGNSAPSVLAQYSVEGNTWSSTLDSSTHKYIRFSYDNGATWTTAIKIAGEDGTSVTITGTDYYNGTLSDNQIGQNVVLYSDTSFATAVDTAKLNTGDAYIVQGYLCVYNKDSNTFICTGVIQGPKGTSGTSSYIFIRYATDANGANISDNPSGKTYIGFYTSSVNTAPTDVRLYTWRKFVGDNAKSIVLSGDSQVFKVSKTNVITPTTITVTAQAVNTTVPDSGWTYSTNGGQTFLSTVPTGVVRNGNIITVTGPALVSNSLVIKASDGTYSDVFTIYKAFDGTDGTPGNPGTPAPIAFLTNENVSFSANANGQISTTSFTTNVVAYTGTTKVSPIIGTITGLPTGMTVSSPVTTANELILTFNIANNTTLGTTTSNSGTITIPVAFPVSTNLKLSWSKINTGATGAGIKSTTVTYGVSDSSSTQPTEWQSTIPEVADGKYLWTRTIIDYTDDAIADTVTYIYAKQGTKGDTGGSGSSVTVSSIQYQEGTSAIAAPTGTWSNSVVAVADGKYLWTKTTFSDNNVAYGVAKQGTAGTAASLVNITPSALYFKSTTGKDGVFTPDYIYLYPRFQTVTYSSWQYSVDGGTTWVAASGANGLTIGTYNSIANSLRISKSSTLYTNDVTSISFRCNSNNSSVYDVVSIAKIYDVVDLQIGSRNLARFTDSEYWSHYGSATTNISFSEGTRSRRIKVECTITDTSSSAYFGVQQTPQARLMKLQPNQEYTLSFLVRGNVSNINYTYLMNSGSTNIPIRMINTPSISETEFTKIVQTFTTTDSVTTSTGSYLMLSYLGAKDPTMWFELEEIQLEAGNVATDWGKAPEDLIEEASNVNIMLSNESHLFEATASGVPTETSVTLDVVGYKGSILSETTVGTIAGLPSAGMTAVVSDNGTTNTKITISVTSALTSDIADYGVLTIPVTVNGNTINKLFSWLKAKAGEMGAAGGDAVTFQVYSSNGYALSINTPTVTLQTFAYIGDTEITAGAAYQWYSYNDGVWSAIFGETLGYLDVSREDVSFSNSYMCKMTFDGVEYSGVATVDDKNDSNAFFSSKPTSYTAGDFWLTAADYTPPGHSVGTLLRAEHTNSTYSDDDWVIGSKYDADISDLKKDIDTYNQHFSFDSVNGVKISARSDDGSLSEFSTTLTNERLSFNYGNNAVAYIDATKMNIKEAEIESPLTITGKYSGSTMEQAPIINIGNFSIVVESNGSLSIVVNT